MKTAFRTTFLEDIEKIDDETLRRKITAVITQIEQARRLTDIHHLKKLKEEAIIFESASANTE